MSAFSDNLSYGSPAGNDSPSPGDGSPPSEEAPAILLTAREYAQAGLCIIPVRADGSKAPALASWKRYQRELPLADELDEWFGNGTPRGIGIVTGGVSGGLEVIDHDGGLFDQWRELVEPQAPGLLGRLPVVQTPRDPAGYHVYYRCPGAIGGSAKLAEETITDPTTGKSKRQTLIETRGEGGYVVAPGSPLACHPSGRPYLHIASPALTKVPTITADERAILLDSARALDRCAKEVKPPSGAGEGPGLRPGDDYNQRGPSWEEILGPQGWEAVRHVGGKTYWRRPGKDGRGWSATTGYCHGKDGSDLLYVFTSNAHPFEPGRAYGRFAAYALLEHGGDFTAAAKALAAQGYGEQHRRPQDADAVEAQLADDGYNLTDVGNAKRMVRRHGADLRYCHLWRKWLVWDGQRWSHDTKGEVCRRAKDTVATLYREVTEEMLNRAPE